MDALEQNRLLGLVMIQFMSYLAALAEYDSKSFPNGITRTDEAILDDFAHWQINQSN